MNKSKTTTDEKEEWLRLVHEGACCAHNDPQKEEKEQFLKSLKKEETVKQSPQT